MKRAGWILLILAATMLAAFLVFRTPDTDPAAMRAKYAGWPSQFVTLPDGLTVHLRDEGPRGAPVILLLHGSNADLSAWDDWAARLKDQYRIVRYDQIGHGLTGPAPDGDYTQAAFAGTIDQVADTLGIDRFVLGGNSMGGGIALAYALNHPQRLDGLVLVDAAGAPVRREGGGNIGFTLARMPGINRLMTQITPRTLVERSLRQSVSNTAIVTPASVDRYWEMLRYPGNRAATAARFGRKREPFTEKAVQNMAVPTLVMWGQEDALIPYAAAGWFAKNLPAATSVSYPQIGHLPMQEAPDTSAADLRRWLGKLPLTTQTR